MAESEDRRRWSGIVSVSQDDDRRTGFMIGPQTVATTIHGLHPKRPLTICRVGESVDAREESVTVLHWDKQRDLCLLKVARAEDFWFVPDTEPVALAAAYLVISCVGRRLESTTVFNEGIVEDAGTERLKLREGQIKSGYSGAPVLDLRTHRLVGMIRVTRGRQTDLGGHALAGKEIAAVRADLRLDRSDRRMQVRNAGRNKGWLEDPVMRGNPPQLQGELLDRESAIAALDLAIGPQHRRVVGRKLAGKSALAGVWVRLPSPLVGATAYVDMEHGPPVSTSHPVIRTALAVLDIAVPEDPFGGRSAEETLGLACWTVMNDLRGGRLVVDLQQISVDAAVDADLAAITRAADPASVAVVAIGREISDETAYSRLSTPIEVGPVGRGAAADLVERTTSGRISRDDAADAFELIDPCCLLPGQVVAACSIYDDAIDIAVDLQRRCGRPLHVQGIGKGEAELAATSADDAISLARAVRESTGGDVRDTLEKAGTTLEREILLSASDPLGVRVTAALRETLEPKSFQGDAVRLDEWTGSQPFTFSVETLAPGQVFALQQITHRVAERSLRAAWVGQIYERILELASQDAEHVPSVSLHLALLRSQIFAGEVSAARRTFTSIVAARALSTIIREESYLSRVEDAHVLVLAWWLGVGSNEGAGRAIGEWINALVGDEDPAGRRGAETVLHDLLRAMSVRALPSPEGLHSVAIWCLSKLKDENVVLADPGKWTVYVSLIGRAGDFSGNESLTSDFLIPALQALRQHLPLLKSLALAGDSRPVLTISRQERRLHRLERGQPKGGHSRLTSAHDLVSWAIEVAPTPDALLTLLAMDPALEAVQRSANLLDSDLPAHHSAASRLARIKRAYRRWRELHSHVDATLLELDYRIVRAEWSIDGSLLRQASESDERWVVRPIPHKLGVLEHLAEARRRRLASLANRFGESVNAIELAARTELQLQTALAVVQRIDIDYRPVDEILARGERSFPSDPQMAFLLAAHHRKRRDFGKAATAYSDVFELSLGDPLLRLRSAVGSCESTSNSFAGGQCDRKDLVTALNRARAYEGTDMPASIVCTRARLELDGTLPTSYLELASAIADVDSFPALATHMRLIRAEMASAAELADSRLLYRFLHDFTDAGLLVSLGATFIRSHELTPGPRTERLQAALILLDGVRVMAAKTWNAPSVNFHQGSALLYACRASQSPNPISWDQERGRQDIDLACAMLQSAADLSVGSFRAHLLTTHREALSLRRELRPPDF
ncbi:trypsin-like peptidase domain-containing protein [Dietzia kunjamensis]|uniref:trypsin-like peptidase domain-containing protein n=1 Tax=Dietzia kunjamensis TaxID=322509 RepID=UPI00336896F3